MNITTPQPFANTTTADVPPERSSLNWIKVLGLTVRLILVSPLLPLIGLMWICYWMDDSQSDQSAAG